MDFSRLARGFSIPLHLFAQDLYGLVVRLHDIF